MQVVGADPVWNLCFIFNHEKEASLVSVFSLISLTVQ